MHAEVVFCPREKFEAISGVDAIHLVCNARHVLDLKKEKKHFFRDVYITKSIFISCI